MLKEIRTKKHRIDLTKPKLMGILNVTPDSFSDGGKFIDPDIAIKHIKQMITDGAEIIDIGGESSRPGSDPVSEKDELERIIPIVKAIINNIKIPISIDTYKPRVADMCLKLGVDIINDITGLKDPEMIKVISKHNAPIIMMHMQGNPKNMQDKIKYNNIIDDINSFFEYQIKLAKKAGISQLILDPGIGFGKTIEHNLQILKNLNQFTKHNFPLLIGTSRKSFIGATLNLEVNDRLEGSLATATIAVMNGANIIRVHDVKESKRVIDITNAIRCS